MKKRISGPLFLAVALFAISAQAQSVTTATNVTAFPLTALGTDVMFPARPTRVAIRCQNPTTNHAATVSYVSSDGSVFPIVLQPGGSLWDVAAGVNVRGTNGGAPLGIVKASGTSGETLPCQETY